MTNPAAKAPGMSGCSIRGGIIVIMKKTVKKKATAAIPYLNSDSVMEKKLIVGAKPKGTISLLIKVKSMTQF